MDAPPRNDKCGFGSRPTSIVSGRSKTPGSWFALPNSRPSSAPRGIGTPRTSIGSSTQRSNICRGVSKRISSSTAVGMSEWSARRRASWSGCRNSPHQPLTVTFTVAS
jgi:hypothetical protein